MRTLMTAALLALLTATGCAECVDYRDVEGSCTLSLWADGSPLPLLDGDAVERVEGFQGGYHIDAGVVVTGLWAGNPERTPTQPQVEVVFDPDDGASWRTEERIYSTPLGEDFWLGGRVLVDPDVVGMTGTLSVQVQDACGNVVTDERSVVVENLEDWTTLRAQDE